MILIVTAPGDEPANKVEHRLRRRGAEIVRFDLADFPSAARLTVSFRHGTPRYLLRLGDRAVALDQLDAIWYRKPGAPAAAPDIVDPATRDVVEEDCCDFLNSLWDAIDCRALPGRPSLLRTTQRKAPQLLRAQAIGFEIPPTIFTNDPAEFLGFYRAQKGRLISKITGSLAMRGRVGEDFSRFTEVVTTRDVGYAHAVSYCPIILQAYVPKRIELRITVVGERVFAAEIHSQATNRTRHDWRRYDLASTPHYPHELPHDIAERCVALVQGSGLLFGTIDMIVTPDGRYVFLELNPSGEYGWIEDLTGLPISDAIADLLVGDQQTGSARARSLETGDA